MRKTGYSRLPVYHESIDRVVGIAHIKDLITPILDEDDGDAPVTKYLRAASYVPDTKDIIPLLSEMKGRHDHMPRGTTRLRVPRRRGLRRSDRQAVRVRWRHPRRS